MFESYDYSYSTAKSELANVDVIVIWDSDMNSMYQVVNWFIDSIDESFSLVFVAGHYGSSAHFESIFPS